MLIDPADLAVTTETPLDQLIAAEEHEHAETLDHRAGRSDEARQVYATRARAVWNSRARQKREALVDCGGNP
jgi:hypothetical protein